MSLINGNVVLIGSVVDENDSPSTTINPSLGLSFFLDDTDTEREFSTGYINYLRIFEGYTRKSYNYKIMFNLHL